MALSNRTFTGFDTPRTFNQFYSTGELNTLFSSIAVVLNGKVDMRDPTMGGSLGGRQRITNLADGTDVGDAITLGQLKSIYSGGQFPTGRTPVASDDDIVEGTEEYSPYVPILFTEDNITTALNENISAVLRHLSFKLKAGSITPALRNMTADNQAVSRVGKAVLDTDAATFENVLEIFNGEI